MERFWEAVAEGVAQLAEDSGADAASALQQLDALKLSMLPGVSTAAEIMALNPKLAMQMVRSMRDSVVIRLQTVGEGFAFHRRQEVAAIFVSTLRGFLFASLAA
jgi:hypothetical protein